VTTLAATDARVLMDALQNRIETLNKLIVQEQARQWTLEAVLLADRSLLTDALLLVASFQDSEPRPR
jgi:hypothetical protein